MNFIELRLKLTVRRVSTASAGRMMTTRSACFASRASCEAAFFSSASFAMQDAHRRSSSLYFVICVLENLATGREPQFLQLQ